MKNLLLILGIAAIALGGLASGGTAHAQTVFDVKLGNKVLGTLSYGAAGNVQQFRTTLSDTPLGVFNGWMQAKSQPASGRQTFTSNTGADGKSRNIIVAHKAGRALETTVEPAYQLTPLSDPARVPAGIIDPVQAIGKMIEAPDCPEKITMYDGRRAVALTLTKTALEETTQTCSLSYRVVAGPPHLRPLNVSRAKMKLIYETGDTRKLSRIELRHGVFRVKLERRD